MLTVPKLLNQGDAQALRRFAALMRQAQGIIHRARAALPVGPPSGRGKAEEWREVVVACQEAEHRLAGLADPLVQVTAWIEGENAAAA
jgi:hypothetical protein